MHCLSKIAVVLTAAAAVTAKATGTPSTNPHEGDITHEKTSYDLTVYAKPGYRGDAVHLNADKCVATDENAIEVRSIRFAGNNCCFFFHDNNCNHLLGAQRVVGNVRDAKAWGFPTREGVPAGIGAVKCLSRSACQVLKHEACSLDPQCGQRGGAQRTCPFEPTCKAYYPTAAGDWDSRARPAASASADGAVLERYTAHDGDGHAIRMRVGSGPGGGAVPAPPAPTSGLGPRPVKAETLGGTDDYARVAATAKRPDYPRYRDYRKAMRAHRKATKAAAKKAAKQADFAHAAAQRAGN